MFTRVEKTPISLTSPIISFISIKFPTVKGLENKITTPPAKFDKNSFKEIPIPRLIALIIVIIDCSLKPNISIAKRKNIPYIPNFIKDFVNCFAPASTFSMEILSIYLSTIPTKIFPAYIITKNEITFIKRIKASATKT